MKRLYVSHGSLDGGKADFDSIGSLSICVRREQKQGHILGRDYEIQMIDYYNNYLDELESIFEREIFIMDIPPASLGDENYLRKIFLKLKKQKNLIFYFDHHPNDKKMVESFYALKEENLIDEFIINERNHTEEDKIPLEEKKCGTEIIFDYFFKNNEVNLDEVFSKITEFAHDQDFGIREIENATKISVVIGHSFNNLKLIYKLSNGFFWDEELEDVYKKAKEKVKRLLSAISFKIKEINVNGGKKKFAYVLMPEENGLKVTPAAQHIFDKTDADVSVLIQRFPLVSFRVRKNEKDVNVGKIAEYFGGGGHQGAATFRDFEGKYIDFRKIDENNFSEIVEKLNSLFENFLNSKL